MVDAYEATLEGAPENDYEHGEMLLYKNMLFEEGGMPEEALRHLDRSEVHRVAARRARGWGARDGEGERGGRHDGGAQAGAAGSERTRQSGLGQAAPRAARRSPAWPLPFCARPHSQPRTWAKPGHAFAVVCSRAVAHTSAVVASQALVMDKLFHQEKRASLLVQLGRYDEAVSIYRDYLLLRNPEHYGYHAGLQARAPTRVDSTRR